MSAVALLFSGAGMARAESALRLPYPESFGAIPASTYDTNHRRIGDASIVVENLDDSRVYACWSRAESTAAPKPSRRQSSKRWTAAGS